MFFMLLFCSMCLNGAASSHFVFYSDIEMRKTRERMATAGLNGPVRELDAYISYISELMCLNGGEPRANTSEDLGNLFVCHAFGDQFNLSDPSNRKKFLENMAPYNSLECIATCIELGLNGLEHQRLSMHEIGCYCRLNYMLHKLAESLQEDRHFLFWKRRIVQINPKHKGGVFFQYTYSKPIAQYAHAQLITFYHLLDRAISAQFNRSQHNSTAISSDHKSDQRTG